MYTLTVENKYGQQMELTHNEAYAITSIEGIDPPDAVINTTRNAAADGSVFNSSYVDNRTITITIAINGPAEDNRLNLYKYFKVKYPVKLYYKNDTRDVWISGHVQRMTVDFFKKKQIAQVVVFCPEPFFNGVDETISNFSTVIPLVEFPYEIEVDDPQEFSQILIEEEKNVINNGDVETGATFIMRATGSVTNPVIYKVDTSEYFKLNITLQTGDEITIVTVKKKKTVTLLRSGVKSNIIGNLANGSTWLQLNPGDNLFTTSATANPENLITYCNVIDQYEGV